MNQNFDNTPGYATAVIKNGAVVFSDCRGLANVSSGTPISTATNFRLASLSKQFTAMAIMILQKRGFLNYEDPISEFLTGFSDEVGRVTIRQLLTHTSGMPDHEKPLYQQFTLGQNAKMSDAMKTLKSKKRLLFPAGSKYRYSDAGYVVLALVIETISGLTFRRLVNREIFSPLEMTDSDVLDETERKIRSRALGYRTKIYYPKCDRMTDNINPDSTSAFELFDDDPLNFIVGDEGVYSSINDMVKWDIAWNGEKLVSASTLIEAMTPTMLLDGSPGKAGFSWLNGAYKGEKIVYQDGSWVGFRNILLKIPKKRMMVILLSNRTDLDTEEERISTAFNVVRPFL